MMAGRRAKVLVAVFGSAGDLFPLVPAIVRLRAGGHDVRCALPRSLRLYPRAWGVPAYPLGSGTELRVLGDDRVVTTRFGGWSSIRRLVDLCVVPALPHDVASLRRLFTQWCPDVVVATTFAPAARIAARCEAIPCVDVTVYPHHRAHLDRSRGFGLALRRAIAALDEEAGAPEGDVVSALAWGVGGDGVVLHDRTVLGDLDHFGDRLGEVVGFPHWDEGWWRPDDERVVDEWLDRRPGPVVLVTLGSFLGARRSQLWAEAATAVGAVGARALFVGPHRRGDVAALRHLAPDVLVVRFVPFSRFASRVDAAVHHGGIGTVFGVLRAGRPSVVVPQAFDHPCNAALVARTGVGAVATDRPLVDALAEVLGEPRYGAAARVLAGDLTPSTAATDRLVERVLEPVR